MSGAEIVHGLPPVRPPESDEIAAEGHISRVQLDPHGGSLERSAAGKVAGRVVTEDGEVGHVAPGGHPRGHRPNQPQDSPLGHAVQVGSFRRLKGRLSLQLGDGIIGHPVPA